MATLKSTTKIVPKYKEVDVSITIKTKVPLSRFDYYNEDVGSDVHVQSVEEAIKGLELLDSNYSDYDTVIEEVIYNVIGDITSTDWELNITDPDAKPCKIPEKVAPAPAKKAMAVKKAAKHIAAK